MTQYINIFYNKHFTLIILIELKEVEELLVISRYLFLVNEKLRISIDYNRKITMVFRLLKFFVKSIQKISHAKTATPTCQVPF